MDAQRRVDFVVTTNHRDINLAPADEWLVKLALEREP
jgi:hypothetical protein